MSKTYTQEEFDLAVAEMKVTAYSECIAEIVQDDPFGEDPGVEKAEIIEIVSKDPISGIRATAVVLKRQLCARLLERLAEDPRVVAYANKMKDPVAPHLN